MLNPDGITTNPPTCIFCGTSTGPFDVEDVFPKWLRAVLPETIQVERVTDEPAHKARRSTVLEAKIRKAVCNPPHVGCNGAWMSRLENDAKPVLIQMINPKPELGLPIKLGRIDQRIVAFWAAEKALCLELSMRQSQRGYRMGHLTPDPFRWLYDHRTQREVPPGTSVFLFAFAPQNPGASEGRMAFHGSIIVANKTKDAQTPVGSFSTITVGCLGLQVFLHDIVVEGGVPREPDPLVMPSWLSPVLIPIWPTLNPTARWLANGPQGVVSQEGLGRLTTWGEMFLPPV